jgi:hypothetical protein
MRIYFSMRLVSRECLEVGIIIELESNKVLIPFIIRYTAGESSNHGRRFF